MATIKTRKIRNHLYTIWTHDYQVLKVSTRIRIEDQFWDEKGNKPRKTHPDYLGIRKQIWTHERKVSDAMNTLINSNIKLTSVNMKRAIDGEAFGHKFSLIESFTEYGLLKRSKVAYGTYKNILLAIQSLTDFLHQDKFDPDCQFITKEVFESWISYQIEVKRYSDATIYKHVKKLREFLNWAYPDQDHKFFKYRIQASDDPIYITENELNILIDAKLKGYYAKTRDLFVFCCTTGMRYSDSQRFTSHCIKDDMIEYRMQKTGGKAMIPMFKITIQILERWEGLVPKISDQKYNVFLKALFKKLDICRQIEVTTYSGHQAFTTHKPLNEVITSHVARKTFVSLSLMKGIPIQDVMKMSGHSDYKSMKPYLAITRSHLKEVAKRWEI